MDIEKLSSAYRVRPILEADIGAVLRLCRGNPMFYQYIGEDVSDESLRADLKALPPGKGLSDKYYVGFYQGSDLIAVADLVLGYPNKSTAFIGFFMVSAEAQGKGVGTALVSELSQCFRDEGFTELRLGYVMGNQQSAQFWKKQGFEETGESSDQGTYRILYMHKGL